MTSLQEAREEASSLPFIMRLENDLTKKQAKMQQRRTERGPAADPKKVELLETRTRAIVNEFYIRQAGDGPLPQDEAACDEQLDTLMQDAKVRQVLGPAFWSSA